MTTIKQPTPEEIHQAAINAGLRYGVGRYAIVEITFKYAISWLQNYQSKQRDTLMPKCKSCGNVLIGIYETDKGMCEKCVNAQQHGAVRSLEQILKEHGVIEYDVRTNAAIQEYINQFQTTASGVSEWISVEDRVPN